MPSSYFLVCSGMILYTIAINAQNLPKNPTPQQVISYQQQQQKQWQLQQLPKNSVLYQYNQRFSGLRSFTFSFKKEKPAGFTLSSLNMYSGVSTNEMNNPGTHGLSSLQLQLQKQRLLYNQWRKQSWWKDPGSGQGSLWLRDFLMNSKKANHLF